MYHNFSSLCHLKFCFFYCLCSLALKYKQIALIIITLCSQLGEASTGMPVRMARFIPCTVKQPWATQPSPAQPSQAVSDLLIAKRDCNNAAVALPCLINGWEGLGTVSALSKCQCLCHVAYERSKWQQAGCGCAGPVWTVLAGTSDTLLSLLLPISWLIFKPWGL